MLRLPTAAPDVVTQTGSPAAGRRWFIAAGTVNPHGLPTRYHWEYGPTPAYGSVTGGIGRRWRSDPPNTVGISIVGEPETTYHFRLIATNMFGTTVGADQVVTTFAPVAPSATTGCATAVGARKATVEATVTPNGAETTYRIEYGPSASYGSFTDPASVGNGDAGQDVMVDAVGS